MEIKIADNCKDSKGEMVEVDHNIVLVSQANWGAAKELFDEKAWALRGTADNRFNRFAGAYKPLLWRRLNDSNDWWMLAPTTDDYGLIFLIREDPWYSAWIDYNKRRYVFDIESRFMAGANEWRQIFGSEVTGA